MAKDNHADAANKARSEAAKGNDNAAKDREEKTVVGQSVHPLIKEAKERKAKADKSKTNAGAVARGEAAKDKERKQDGTFKPVKEQCDPPLDKHPQREAKATASKTNAGGEVDIQHPRRDRRGRRYYAHQRGRTRRSRKSQSR